MDYCFVFLKINSRILLLFLLLLSASVVLAQQEPCLTCVDHISQLQNPQSCCATKNIVDAATKNILDKRDQNYDFHYTLRKIQEPSQVSSMSNWTIHNMGYQKKNFILDADVQIPISIGGKRFGLNELQVIPRFQFRIFQDDPNVPYGTKGDASLPVRTPSAMPGIAYYRTFRNWWNEKKMLLPFVGIYLYHHSDGQDGNEIDSSGGHLRVNVYNGNFSENLIGEFIIGGKVKFEGNDAPFFLMNDPVHREGKQRYVQISNAREFYWKLSYEWHPKFLSNEVFDQLRIYGRKRINIRTAFITLPTLLEVLDDGRQWCKLVPEKKYERWRFTGNLNYILDRVYYRGEDMASLQKISQFNLQRRLNLWLTAYRIIRPSKNAAVFAQAGYFGSDNYNIFFNESFWHFKIGLAFGFFDQPDQPDSFKSN
ncbi:MAG: hypothetical protein QM768_20225 [Agriterribacter sp.]